MGAAMTRPMYVPGGSVVLVLVLVLVLVPVLAASATEASGTKVGARSPTGGADREHPVTRAMKTSVRIAALLIPEPAGVRDEKSTRRAAATAFVRSFEQQRIIFAVAKH